VLLGACAFGSYLFLRGTDPDKYHAKINELVNMSEGKATSGSGGKRLAFYRQTFRAIPDHALLGNGVGSWAVFYFGNDQRAYPHNLLLEIAFEQGFLGIAAFAVFLVAIGAAVRRTYQLSGSHFAVAPLLITYALVVSNFSGDLDDNRMLWLWAGLALAFCRNASLAYARLQRYAANYRMRPANSPKQRRARILQSQEELSNPA
jgi:O-antigen ligase